ncbi:peptide-binding protein [Desulfocurvus vexinensis]|uniref:peptide-binding protein n=1 Tax=Desulfocurvus vexinensis TaxID=399548 RepID=UPI00048D83D2|nr:peptide-binding protein [Desulfocurvus vexinensis]
MPDRRFFSCFFLVLGLLLWGCDSAPEGQRPADGPGKAVAIPETPEDGGTYVTASIGEPSNLIPPLASDSASHEVASLLYVSLLKYNKNLEIEPRAAKSFEVLDGGRLIRFELRPGILWNDGQELTAEDVEFTYKLYIDPEVPTAYAESYKQVREFKITGRYTFEVRYDKPLARALTSWMLDILPKHVLENQNILDTPFARAPVGAGPYRLTEWTQGSRLVLTANPDYFEGRPHFDRVIYRIIPDQATMFMELKARNLDLMDLTPQQYSFQTSGPDWEANFRKYQYLSFGYTYVGYNLSNPMFADVRVRRAFAHAIDKQAIVKGVLLGLGQPTIGPYKPGTWVYNDAIRDYPFDPEAARALLAGAGWTDTNGDGVLDKDGRPFEFTLMTNQGNESRIKAATIIQANLAAIGVRVKIRTVEWSAFIKEFIDKGRFEALVMGWNIIIDPDLYNVWHSSQAEPGGLNFVGYKNPELDALLDEGRHLLGQAERKAVYDKVQQLLHEDQPYTFLYCPLALPVVAARIQGIEPAPAGISHNFEKWWIPKALQRSTMQQ